MSEDVKQVGTQFASDYLTSVQNNAVNNLTEGDDDTAGGGGAADVTKINDPSLASQIRLMDIQNTQQQLNLENAAELLNKIYNRKKIDGFNYIKAIIKNN